MKKRQAKKYAKTLCYLYESCPLANCNKCITFVNCTVAHRRYRTYRKGEFK